MLDAYRALMAPGVNLLTVADLLDRPAWMADAACREHPELSWFPERGERLDAIRAVCSGCLARDECLAFALEHGDTIQGVWGGTSHKQRKRLSAPAPATHTAA